jgi:hypothetical protein
MNMESLRFAIEILAEQRDNKPEYERMLRYVAKLHRLPVETIERLLLCHLADKAG